MRIISAGVWFCPNNTSLFKCSHTSWLSVITNEERQGTWGCSWGASVWGVSIESTCIVGSSWSTFTAKHIWHLNGGGRRACLFSLCKEDNCFQIISAPVCCIAPVSCLLYPPSHPRQLLWTLGLSWDTIGQMQIHSAVVIPVFTLTFVSFPLSYCTNSV